jgi:hypothetical protein
MKVRCGVLCFFCCAAAAAPRQRPGPGEATVSKTRPTTSWPACPGSSGVSEDSGRFISKGLTSHAMMMIPPFFSLCLWDQFDAVSCLVMVRMALLDWSGHRSEGACLLCEGLHHDIAKIRRYVDLGAAVTKHAMVEGEVHPQRDFPRPSVGLVARLRGHSGGGRPTRGFRHARGTSLGPPSRSMRRRGRRKGVCPARMDGIDHRSSRRTSDAGMTMSARRFDRRSMTDQFRH